METFIALQAIPNSWPLNDQGDGTVTITMLVSNSDRIRDLGLYRDDGSLAQAGDVLSMQPNGIFQTRPLGTNGPFEKCKLFNNWFTFAPFGDSGWSRMVRRAS